MADNNTTIMNPFPGLRPFGLNESHLFFGREGQSQTILQYLSEYRFAAITGASGSGKSSLIYCGVVPLLYGGFINPAKNNWQILTARPGNTPILNLANALAKTDSEKSGKKDISLKPEYFYSLLERHSHGLVEAVQQIGLDADENLLIIIDQFEELFRYKKSSKTGLQQKDETGNFIKLLVNCTKNNNLPVYIVITMRSDFIGECSDFQDFTELINKSNYLVPQMTRIDFEHVITGPLKVIGCDIEPRLVQSLLNSLENNHDQLPVLQHAMMRTFEIWKKHNTNSSPIGIRDYIAAGKIENALSLHANEAFNLLNDHQRQLCKIIFKALTEKGSEGKGIRRPATIREISGLAQEQPAEIIAVVEVFREPGCSFLTPSVQTPLSPDTVIDLSHESLMRIWDKLKSWVDEEANSAQMYQHLVELAGLYQIGRTGLMRPPDLHLASNWKKTQNPNSAWARRYNPAFEKAMVYLNTSEKKLQVDEENKVRIQRRELNRTKRFAIIMSVFAVAFFGLMFYAYRLSQEAIKQKDLAEGYAKILEGEKDTAVRASLQKEYERLFAIRQKDSIERVNFLKLVQQEEQTEQANQKVNEITKRSEELEKSAEQIQQEKILAEQKARQAQEGLSKAESDKLSELRKRMLVLSQSVALKSTQIDDPQLSALLASEAYVLNRQNGGQLNHPDIYHSLILALNKLNNNNFNSLKGQKGTVNALVFDPARNILYSADNTGAIDKWTFRRRNPTPSTLIANEDANTCLAITVDGRWIACGSEDRTVQLINALQPSQTPRIFDAHDGSVTHVSFIPGRNAMVTAGSDNKVKYWDLLVNESSIILQDLSGINDIAVSPSGQSVMCASNSGRLVQYNVSLKRIELFYQHSAPIMSVTYDYEGDKVAFGDRNGKILILSAQSKKVLKIINAHSSRILDLKYSPDNRMLASSGLDGVVRIWNAQDWNDLPIVIKEEASWVQSLTFSPDGRNLFASSNNNNLIYIWPVRVQYVADEVCGYIRRQLTQQEWDTYIGSDIPYQEVCK